MCYVKSFINQGCIKLWCYGFWVWLKFLKLISPLSLLLGFDQLDHFGKFTQNSEISVIGTILFVLRSLDLFKMSNSISDEYRRKLYRKKI
jgi:hypothetical protein